MIVKRLEASALRGRVHDGLRLMWIAESGDIFSGDHAHQRMIPAFALRHDRDMLPRLAGFDGDHARIGAAGIARSYPD